MQISYTNQYQPNTKYIIYDSSIEFNFPNFDFNEYSMYYKNNEYDNKIHLLDDKKLKTVFQTNQEKYEIVIFNDYFKNIIKQNTQIIGEDFSSELLNQYISSYLCVNNVNWNSIFNFMSLNVFSESDHINYQAIIDFKKIKIDANQRLNSLKNLMNLRNYLNLDDIDNKLNNLQRLINELNENCTINFSYYNQYDDEYIPVSSVILNNETYICEINEQNLCSFKVPTYKLIKKDSYNFKILIDQIYPTEKTYEGLNYQSLIEKNRILDFGKLFNVKIVYEDWCELKYNTLLGADLDLHCYEFDENLSLIGHCFWGTKIVQGSDINLIHDDVGSETSEHYEVITINNFKKNHWYLFTVENYLFNIVSLSNLKSEDFKIIFSLFLKDKFYQIFNNNLDFANINKPNWATFVCNNNKVYQLNKFITDAEVPTYYYNNDKTSLLKPIISGMINPLN